MGGAWESASVDWSPGRPQIKPTSFCPDNETQGVSLALLRRSLKESSDQILRLFPAQH